MNTKTSLRSEEVFGEENWKNTVSKLIEESAMNQRSTKRLIFFIR
jgi:hypothetical protein